MAFSTKQLLLFTFAIAAGLGALANADKLFVREAVRMSVFATLVLFAYGIWTSQGEPRAFRIGFLIWGGVFFFMNVPASMRPFRLFARQTNYLIELLANVLKPDVSDRDTFGDWFNSICCCLLTLAVGIAGGVVTVFFYRKRQRMLTRALD